MKILIKLNFNFHQLEFYNKYFEHVKIKKNFFNVKNSISHFEGGNKKCRKAILY